MHVDPSLLTILVCPITKGPLRLSQDQQELISRSAGCAYPIEKGVPLLLESKARPLTPDEVLANE